MKNRTCSAFVLSLLLITGLLVMQACSLPWLFSEKVKSMVISYRDGAIVPEEYIESVMEIEPDYELRTIAVNYKMGHPRKQVRTEEDTFSGEAVIGGEYFDRFEELVGFVNEWVEKPTDEEVCVGGYQLSVKMSVLNGDVLSLETSSCPGTGGENLIKTFNDDVIGLLTKNVY